MWFITKSKMYSYYDENNEDYILNENDIIKLGRIKYEVIKKHINIKNDKIENNYKYNISEINKKSNPVFNINIKRSQYKINEKTHNVQIEEFELNQEINNNEDVDEINEKEHKIILNKTISKEKSTKTQTNDERIKNVIKEKDNDDVRCRICYDINSTKENPLIRLCKCKDYIHFECLKFYLSKKYKILENQKHTVITYNCNKFNCEVCLSPYPIRFRIPEFNKIYELIDINLPQELDYIVLESLDYIKDKNNIKTVHIVMLEDEEINIGRMDTNDIIDNDISVSRYHAQLKYDKENGNLILRNLSEKFGTLVLIRGNIKINENKINFQIGNCFVSANLTLNDK